jgi:hypothetical protein
MLDAAQQPPQVVVDVLPLDCMLTEGEIHMVQRQHSMYATDHETCMDKLHVVVNRRKPLNPAMMSLSYLKRGLFLFFTKWSVITYL